MTGQPLHELGAWLNGVRLPRNRTTWAGELSRAGYSASAHGKLGVVGMEEDLDSRKSKREAPTASTFRGRSRARSGTG